MEKHGEATESEEVKKKMIYTPVRRIPIGEAIKKPDGTYALRVKRSNREEFEEIPLEALCSSVIMSAEHVTTGVTGIHQRVETRTPRQRATKA